MEDMVSIPVAEYERLLKDSRRVRSLRNRMDEFYIRRKLLLTNNIAGRTALRRVVLNGISVDLSEEWDG